MAKKVSKTIDATQVICSNMKGVNLPFNEVLKFMDRANIEDNSDRTISLGLIKKVKGYYLGYVETTQKSGLPPGHDPSKKVYEPLTVAGLGFSNVFLFDRKTNILLYQFEKNGCYLPSFIRKLQEAYNRKAQTAISIENIVVLKKGALEKLANFEKIKFMELVVANPKKETQNIKDINTSVRNALDSGDQLNAEELRISYKMKGGKPKGLERTVIYDMLKSIKKLIAGNKEGYNNIQKVAIQGYLNDPEDGNKLISESIDLITDKFKKKIEITQNRKNRDSQISEKTTELIKLFNKIKGELREQYKI